MKKKTLLGIVLLSGLVIGIIALAVTSWLKPGLRRTSLAEHTLKAFDDAAIQMEIPTETPFALGSSAGVLIMVHKVSRGLKAEADYLIKVQVRRMSKTSMENRLEFASLSSDEIQQWRYKFHSRLETRKEAALWYIRKDIETPDGEFLFVDGELTVTEFAEADLLEIKRIIESIRPVPR